MTRITECAYPDPDPILSWVNRQWAKPITSNVPHGGVPGYGPIVQSASTIATNRATDCL
jgi:hypothetical protein